MWRNAHARAIEVEVIFRDLQQHRERVEKRTSDISGLKLPTWVEIMSREYERWQREHFVIDTAANSVAESVEKLRRLLPT